MNTTSILKQLDNSVNKIDDKIKKQTEQTSELRRERAKLVEAKSALEKLQ